MATIVNKMLRVIPKNKKISAIDCHGICSNLARTGGELWEKVIYYINEEENCLDIKYKSRRGRGELGIEDEKGEFDIWIISNGEGGPDDIKCLNHREYKLEDGGSVNLYCFDEIRIKGNHEKLLVDLYPNFFHFNNNQPSIYLQQALNQEKNEHISFRFDGIYTAGTIYDVGEKYSIEPELVSKDEFFIPRPVLYWEAQFLFYMHHGNYGIEKFLKECIKDKLSSFQWERKNLYEIQFCHKGRIVKQIKTGDHWLYFNSEFFDNTVEKNWIEYMALFDRGLI